MLYDVKTNDSHEYISVVVINCRWKDNPTVFDLSMWHHDMQYYSVFHDNGKSVMRAYDMPRFLYRLVNSLLCREQNNSKYSLQTIACTSLTLKKPNHFSQIFYLKTKRNALHSTLSCQNFCLWAFGGIKYVRHLVIITTAVSISPLWMVYRKELIIQKC